MSDELHVVLGASGGTGSVLVLELISRGHRVRAVSRGGGAPRGSRGLKADVSTPEGAKAASAGAAVVYHAAQPDYTKWAAEFPPMTNNMIGGAEGAGAKLVFADNLYMYGPRTAQPMTEGTPEKAMGKKGMTRILMAERLLHVHRSGRARVAIGRSSDYYGPGGIGTIAGETVFEAALAGRTVRWPSSLDAPHTFSFLPDMARALATLGERTEAEGGVWHLPAAPPITGRQLLYLVSAELGHPVRAGVASRATLRVIGLFSPFVRELAETVYQFEGPFVSDASKFERAFGPFVPTPHPEAVARTAAWFRARRG